MLRYALLSNCRKYQFAKEETEDDVKKLLAFFENMQEINLEFFYDYNKDVDNRVQNIFWANASCRGSYEDFWRLCQIRHDLQDQQVSHASGRVHWSEPPPAEYNICGGSHQRRKNTIFRVGVPDFLALHEQQEANMHADK